MALLAQRQRWHGGARVFAFSGGIAEYVLGGVFLMIIALFLFSVHR